MIPLPSRSSYLPQNSVFRTLSLWSSLKVRDQVSHPYSTTGRITVLYILIFSLIIHKERTKIFAFGNDEEIRTHKVCIFHTETDSDFQPQLILRCTTRFLPLSWHWIQSVNCLDFSSEYFTKQSYTFHRHWRRCHTFTGSSSSLLSSNIFLYLICVFFTRAALGSLPNQTYVSVGHFDLALAVNSGNVSQPFASS
jgi:hypothetical protein